MCQICAQYMPDICTIFSQYFLIFAQYLHNIEDFPRKSDLHKNVRKFGNIYARKQCQTFLKSSLRLFSGDCFKSFIGQIVLPQIACKVDGFSAKNDLHKNICNSCTIQARKQCQTFLEVIASLEITNFLTQSVTYLLKTSPNIQNLTKPVRKPSKTLSTLTKNQKSSNFKNPKNFKNLLENHPNLYQHLPKIKNSKRA